MDHSSSSYCNRTIGSYVYNLTSSYTDQSNEASVVITSVVMFILAVVFVNLNLFSRLTQFTAILNPEVRVFLSAALSLFLPIMSYLFSDAKYAREGNSGDELPLRARVILLWMLLVELIRKKVEAFLVTRSAGVINRRTALIERAGRIAFLGYIVFFVIQSAGRKAVFTVLWLVAAAKFLQRVAFIEAGRRSYAHGKNAQVLASYMNQLLPKKDQEQISSLTGSDLLKKCKYVVMGEETMVKKAIPHGYELDLEHVESQGTVVTVDRIWSADEEKFLGRHPKHKRLCLSFALFKLLRRRFEELPIPEAETRNCRDLIFNGLWEESKKKYEEQQEHKQKAEKVAKLHKEKAEKVAAATLFQVMNDELHFLCECYHSVVPVVLASPLFFLANYVLFPVALLGLCVMAIVLYGNGDVPYVFHGIVHDNYFLSMGLSKLITCLTKQVFNFKSPATFFATIDLSITVVLSLAFVYEEVWEFSIFLLSDWFMVSLICETTRRPCLQESNFFRGALRSLRWLRHRIRYRNLCIKQFSALWFCPMAWLPQMMPTDRVPREAKHLIVKRLHDVLYKANTCALSNGRHILEESHPNLMFACESDSVAEVILIWHIATFLLAQDVESQARDDDRKKVATKLSMYCAYLVVVRPELLPDNQEATKQVYRDMKKELKRKLGCWAYYFSPRHIWYKKMKKLGESSDSQKTNKGCWGQNIAKKKGEETETVVQKGARLFGEIKNIAVAQRWELLASVWTELIIYIAPSSDEAHVSGHEKALMQGGEFVTVLWALATHTGVTRPSEISPTVREIVVTPSEIPPTVREIVVTPSDIPPTVREIVVTPSEISPTVREIVLA